MLWRVAGRLQDADTIIINYCTQCFWVKGEGKGQGVWC